jgi:hypothetical protein
VQEPTIETVIKLSNPQSDHAFTLQQALQKP